MVCVFRERFRVLCRRDGFARDHSSYINTSNRSASHNTSMNVLDVFCEGGRIKNNQNHSELRIKPVKSLKFHACDRNRVPAEAQCLRILMT